VHSGAHGDAPYRNIPGCGTAVAIDPPPRHPAPARRAGRGKHMFQRSFTAVILAAAGLAAPAAATNYGVGYNDPQGVGSGYGSPIPFSAGDIYGGGSAGKNLVSAYAQTTPYDGVQAGTAGGSAQVTSDLDLSALAPLSNKVTLKYSLQVGGIDAAFGTSAIESSWLIGYTNGLGKLVGMGGFRSLSASGQLIQQIKTWNGTDIVKTVNHSIRGAFTYNMVIDPSVTPFTTIFASTSCSVTEAVGSGGYCATNFGFGIPPRPATPSILSRGASLETAGVPEPASWAMMMLGFGLVGTLARRRTMAVSA
jgi:hypothetical protein